MAIHDNHVFMYFGQPITRHFSQGLKSACKRAEIMWGRDLPGGFIFHDLRHTFITDMDQRYDVVDDSDKLSAIRKLEDYRDGLYHSIVDQNVDLSTKR